MDGTQGCVLTLEEGARYEAREFTDVTFRAEHSKGAVCAEFVECRFVNCDLSAVTNSVLLNCSWARTEVRV